MADIFLLEDDKILNRGITIALEKDAHTVTAVYGYFDALQKYLNRKYDLFLIDINLPDGSGLEFCKKIRKISETPVLFLTANDTEEDMLEGFSKCHKNLVHVSKENPRVIVSNFVKDKKKVEYIGPVLSDRLLNGDKLRGCKFCGFKADKPIIMVIGGSLGAKSLNQAIRDNLPELLKHYQIIHICGKGQVAKNGDCEGYKQFEYVDAELKDLMQAADVVVSRAGSNSIFELLSLNKPMVLVPLPTGSSRGEQMLNAKSFEARGYCKIVADEKLSDGTLFLDTLAEVYQNREKYVKNMKNGGFKAIDNKTLAQKIQTFAKNKEK